MDEFLKECKETYGEVKGFRIYTTILPGILGDFKKMLSLAKVDAKVSEEYKIDDEDVTKEEYEAALNEYKSWELMYAPDNTLTDISSLPDHIRNY